jgi:hypothetical protein
MMTYREQIEDPLAPPYCAVDKWGNLGGRLNLDCPDRSPWLGEIDGARHSSCLSAPFH